MGAFAEHLMDTDSFYQGPEHDPNDGLLDVDKPEVAIRLNSSILLFRMESHESNTQPQNRISKTKSGRIR